jgi:hypothetical protein
VGGRGAGGAGADMAKMGLGFAIPCGWALQAPEALQLEV